MLAALVLGYCSLVTFREVFFVNKVHRKPENCSAKSCECMFSVHRGAVTGHGVNSNGAGNTGAVFLFELDKLVMA